MCPVEIDGKMTGTCAECINGKPADCIYSLPRIEAETDTLKKE